MSSLTNIASRFIIQEGRHHLQSKFNLLASTSLRSASAPLSDIASHNKIGPRISNWTSVQFEKLDSGFIKITRKHGTYHKSPSGKTSKEGNSYVAEFTKRHSPDYHLVLARNGLRHNMETDTIEYKNLSYKV